MVKGLRTPWHDNVARKFVLAVNQRHMSTGVVVSGRCFFCEKLGCEADDHHLLRGRGVPLWHRTEVQAENEREVFHASLPVGQYQGTHDRAISLGVH